MEEITLGDIASDLSPTSPESLERRFIVAADGFKVPVLFRHRPEESSRLLVTYNGAISRSKAPDGIVFQRSKWLDDFRAPTIQIADPTMLLHRRLQIGWGQGSKASWAIDTYLAIINKIREVFDLPSAASTLHYGSSAGGFQAMAVAGIDRGSSALVNNPQIDWSRYNSVFVNALLRDVFEGKELAEIKDESPERVNILDFYRREDYVPEVNILVNAGSEGDVDQQVRPLIDDLQKFESLGTQARLSLGFYHEHRLGHNPLGQTQTIQLINEKLNRIDMRA